MRQLGGSLALPRLQSGFQWLRENCPAIGPRSLASRDREGVGTSQTARVYPPGRATGRAKRLLSRIAGLMCA